MKKYISTLLALSLFLSSGAVQAGSFSGKDATGTTKQFKSNGTGTSPDPYVPQHILTDGTNNASVSAGGAVKVDNSAVTQPVSGTFWQATQPVSASALPLPTGASTEATLSALNGKVTTINTGAVVISGPLPAGTNNVGSVSPVGGFAVTPYSLSDGQTAPLQVDSKANLKTVLAPNDGIDVGDVTVNNAAGAPIPTQIGDGTNLVNIDSGAAFDGRNNTRNSIPTNAYMYGFNGTAWDRWRSGQVGVQTSSVGFHNTIPMGKFTSAGVTLADGNTAPLQMLSDGSLRGINKIWDGTNVVQTFVNGADATTNTRTGLIGYSYSSLFNNTTWDRIRGGLIGVQTAATGFQNVIPMAQYSFAGITLADGNTSALQVTNAGELKGMTKVWDGVNVVQTFTAGSDALTNSRTGIYTVGYNYGWNGTTWDRLKTGLLGPQTSQVGFQNNIPLGQYSFGGISIADGSSAPLQLTNVGELKGVSKIWDGANVVQLSTAGADANSNTKTSLNVTNFGSVYNGSTWDRVRSGLTGNQTSATGFQNNIPMAQYSFAGITPVDGSTLPLQMTSTADLKTAGKVWDGTNVAVVQTAGTDAASNTSNRLSVASRGNAYNGSTWDMIRSGQVGVQTVFTGFQNVLNIGRYNLTPPTLADGNGAPLQQNASGSLKVDGSAVTQPVSGTITANAGTGTMAVSIAAPTGPGAFQETVGTSAVQLTSLAVTQGVNIKALKTNTGLIYVGIAGVTTGTGYPLAAGETLFLSVDNANRIYAISDTAAQAIAVAGS